VDKREREAIALAALARSRADQTEVMVTARDSALTRFARGISNQNVASIERAVSVRAVVGGRTGVAATNDTDEPALDAVVARAIALATFSPADPHTPTLPSGGPVQAPDGSFVDATARAGADERAHACAAVFEASERAGFWAAGYVSNGVSGITIANSSGALASYDGTNAAANIKMTGPDSTGFAESYHADVRRIDAAALGRRAVEKARASAAPRSVEPGPWTVILEPAAIGELLAYVTSHFSAQSYDEGSSFFAGHLGEQLLGPNVTIGDDYAHPLAPSMPFDYEAQPKQRVTLVERGIVRAIVTDSYYGNKLGLPNTGHALPAPNAWGPQALNIVVANSDTTADELIATTKRGLLVTRFWYIRTVDHKQAIVTGMTRDGTFLIEDGKIAGGVRNMRFNQSIVEALRSIAFANDATRTGGYSYSLVTPTVKIENFTFTSGTDF